MTREPEKHIKGWGYELWIANSPLYCGKILHFEKGKRCSFHYHKLKDEVFYVSKGRVAIKYGMDDDISNSRTIFLDQGERFHVPVGMRHQMIAHEETDLLEFSTQHFEEDSYRIIKGD